MAGLRTTESSAGPRRGEIVFREGQPATTMSILLRGEFHVRRAAGTLPVFTVNGCTTASAQSLGCAYGPTVGEQFGSAGVGSQRAPGYQQVDLTAGKGFDVTESQRVEFRADFFNAFNFASYGNPDNNITDSNFGQISSTRSLSRQIQLSLHYDF